ncbi:hypothetical protein N7475_008713 [Penicillium sp. IBT 31633x]|nr:hypothetical protein N7475_008713 [Penicillium sp. IBT 31633x]
MSKRLRLLPTHDQIWQVSGSISADTGVLTADIMHLDEKGHIKVEYFEQGTHMVRRIFKLQAVRDVEWVGLKPSFIEGTPRRVNKLAAIHGQRCGFL